jgi:hypothetical protein
MERISQKDKAAYRGIVACCKKSRGGVTGADISAKTALPLETVRELLPLCADEYAARLKVTESGEILYVFPRGFSSRYRGARAVLGRFFEKVGSALARAAAAFFKVWILVMLVGYFVLFIVIALAAIMLSVVAQSSSRERDSRSRDGGGGFFVVTHLLDMIIRIWFYSELTKSFNRNEYTRRSRSARRPLYKAVFSFVFGDGDPNADIETREKRAALAYIQTAGGVISLPEYMILTGKRPQEAEDAITAFCAAYGGSPEATEDGTVVYRFDALLLNAETGQSARRPLYQGPLRKIGVFSSNEKKFNGWFSVLNGVNLLFGGYFLFNAFKIGAISSLEAALKESYLYAFVYHITERFLHIPPLPLICWGLGAVPFAFSLFFWLIPWVRNLRLRRENERSKLANLRQFAFDRVWQNPREARAGEFAPADPASRPERLSAAQNALITELSSYTRMEAAAGENGELSYSFDELRREKEALERYRETAEAQAPRLGGVIFET